MSNNKQLQDWEKLRERGILLTDKDIIKEAKESGHNGRGWLYIGIADVRDLLKKQEAKHRKEKLELIESFPCKEYSDLIEDWRKGQKKLLQDKS